MTTALLLFPDFALILLGAAIRRWMGLGDHFWNGVEKLVYFILFPALLINAIVKTRLDLAAAVPLLATAFAAMVGGMLLGLSRRAATDFSFFLAIPTLMGAGAYDLYKHRALFSLADIPFFAVGLIFSFISAWFCVRWLLRYIANHTFTVFAWYRIAFGILILLSWQMGWVNWAD